MKTPEIKDEWWYSDTAVPMLDLNRYGASCLYGMQRPTALHGRESYLIEQLEARRPLVAFHHHPGGKVVVQAKKLWTLLIVSVCLESLAYDL